MAKKSLYELQYENAKIENDVNRGCGMVTLGFLGFFGVLVLLVMIAGLS